MPGALEPIPYIQPKEDPSWVPQAIWVATESRATNTNCPRGWPEARGENRETTDPPPGAPPAGQPASESASEVS